MTILEKCLQTGLRNPQFNTKILPDTLRTTAEYIRSVQLPDGAIPWFVDGKLDPWDHVEAAMGLSVAGFTAEAEAAYAWLTHNQLQDGSWRCHYFEGEDEFSHLRQPHFIAYIATGVWHHYLVTGDRSFLLHMWPTVRDAMGCIVRYQTPEGDICWAFDDSGEGQGDALVTGCCSILRSLDCAMRIATTLQFNDSPWRAARDRLRLVLREQPQRFDRTWPSKDRFAMDWYYPVLSGAWSPSESQQWLAQRWSEFVEPELGCRCVADEPWVTMAESSELVMALVACGKKTEAITIFEHIQQWRHQGDGGYWTGYVFRDDEIWPAEKTSWTAAAVILAADALNHYSAAHNLFSEPLL